MSGSTINWTTKKIIWLTVRYIKGHEKLSSWTHMHTWKTHSYVFQWLFFFFQRMMEGGREAASPRKEVQLRLLRDKHLYTVWRKVTLVLTYMHQGQWRGGGVASLQSGQGWTFSHIDINGEPCINVLGSRMGGGGRGVASQIDAAMSQTTQSQTIHTVGNKTVRMFGSFGLCIEYIFWLNG